MCNILKYSTFVVMVLGRIVALSQPMGRPWRPYAKTVYLRTDMGKQIAEAGWDNGRNPENEKTAYYGE